MNNLEKLIESSSLPYFVKSTDEAAPRLAFYIDNHLITTHNFCEAQFYLKHMRRLRLKGPSGMAMSIGGWWSAVLEDFYNLIKEQQNPRISPTGLVLPLSGYPSQKDFIESAAKRWREAKMDELAVARPKAYKEFGGSTGAALMAMQYYVGQGRLDCQNWKIVGAEKGFGQKGEVLLYEDDKILVYYIGKPDLVVLADGGNTLLPVEHKTIHRIQSNITVKYKPHPQIMGYVFSLNRIAKDLGYDKPVDRCIVNVAARAMPAEKPKDGKVKPRFTRIFPHYAVEELEEWRQNVVAKVKRLHYSLINDEWLWKDGQTTCHLYGGCEYRGIHSKPPSMRDLVISSDYVEIASWSPYVVEDEDEEEI
jgi:hypothetical protein